MPLLEKEFVLKVHNYWYVINSTPHTCTSPKTQKQWKFLEVLGLDYINLLVLISQGKRLNMNDQLRIHQRTVVKIAEFAPKQ